MHGGRTYVLGVALGAALLAAAPARPAAAQLATPSPAPSPTPTAAPTPTPTPRHELGVESGKTTGVGVVPAAGEDGNAIVKLTGGFSFDGAIDFFSSSLTVRTLLRERGGAGELVRGFQGAGILPAVLVRKSGNANNVVFASPGSSRPSLRLTLRRKPEGLYLVNLKVSRATIPADPERCTGTPPATTLDLVLVLDDGSNEPVTVAGDVTWVCDLAADKLRVPEDGVEPPPGDNLPPKASIRTDLVTRETGQPSIVLLDGANSSDADGTIASYTFRVTEKPSGQTVFGPFVSAGAYAIATLPKGDYTAVLVVTDDKGLPSAPATRGLSIK